MQYFRNIKSLFIWIAIPMVMGLYFNDAAFWHLHKLDNGVVIEHAHPYSSDPIDGTPYQHHSHSSLEIIILSQLSNITGLIVVITAFAVLKPITLYKTVIRKTAFIYTDHFLIADFQRGPPSR